MIQRDEQRRVALRRFMKAKGLKAAPWALKAGMADSVVRNYLAGRAKSMNSDTLERLAAAAEATVAEIIGEKLPEPKLGRDVATVKSLEVRASMGGGFEVVEEPEGPPLFFRRQWLEKLLNGRPGALRVLDLGGDSMLPTINDGDVGLVLLPDEETKFISGAIYAAWDGHGLIVKRLEAKVGGVRPRLRVISDNRAIYEPYEVDAEDVRIIGQILWRGGRV